MTKGHSGGMQQAKVVFLGATSSGKSNLISRFVEGQYCDYKGVTIGVEYACKSLPESDIKFAIWDTPGLERFRRDVPLYCRNAVAAVIVFDVTSHDSFAKAKRWIKELQQEDDIKIIILVGNKVDLVERGRVTQEEAQIYAAEKSLTFWETSAKHNINVTNIFQDIAKRLSQAAQQQVPLSCKPISKEASQPAKKSMPQPAAGGTSASLQSTSSPSSHLGSGLPMTTTAQGSLSVLEQQQSLVVSIFHGASFLAQVVCGSAGVAVPGLLAIAKLLQKLNGLMQQSAATDVTCTRLSKLATSLIHLLESVVPSASIQAKQPAVVALLDGMREWLASVVHFVEDDCKPRTFSLLRKTFTAHKRFDKATAIVAAFDDLKTTMQAAGFAVGVHVSQQVDMLQQSMTALQAQADAQIAASARVMQMVEKLTAQGTLPDAIKAKSDKLLSKSPLADGEQEKLVAQLLFELERLPSASDPQNTSQKLGRLTNDDDWANCPICFLGYTQEGVQMPRMLPCSHEVCTQCITALYDGHEVQCPFCRDKFAPDLRRAGEHGVLRPAHGFPAARRLIQHLEKVQAGH